MLSLHDDMARSTFVRQVAAGLEHPTDAAMWRRKAKERIRDLHEDLMDFGLAPDEQRELDQLEQLVGKGVDRLDLWTGIVGLAFVIFILVCCRLAQ